MDSLQVYGHAMPVRGVVAAKFRPVYYGGSIRFSFVLAPVSKAFVCWICFVKIYVSLCEFQSKILLRPGV